MAAKKTTAKQTGKPTRAPIKDRRGKATSPIKPPKERKIWLIGTASSGADAPYDDPSWEIWGVSARASYVTRATRWFELHRLEGEPRDWADRWRETMKTFTADVELLMFYPEYDLGPNVKPYPYDWIVGRFGTYFMTSTFAWMMALAIDELRPPSRPSVPGRIGFSGVDMEYGTEYREQRAGFHHFIDMCRILRIPVTRLADSGLSFEPVPYPLWQDDPLLAKLTKRRDETARQLEEYNNSQRLTQQMIAQNRILEQELRQIQTNGKGYDVAARLAALEKENVNLTQTSQKLSADIVALNGRWDEQNWLKSYLTP